MLGREYNLDNEVNLSGIFIAEVINNLDPKALERVRVRVIGVHNMNNNNPNHSVWANHCAFSKGLSGEIPDIGDFVYVQFIQNDPMNLVWLGWVRTMG
ncbi:hypothetical protein GW796_05910 [archaeon]|nr:hypothetical protein [archaeon]NCQ51419.1 hypothetical protein [archaeon]NCT58755.1 hypothetical protein [archaeon]